VTNNNTAADIVARHYGDAWRYAIVKRFEASRGRYTKAKERARDDAELKAATIRAIVEDLRAAGIDVKES
jgi:hypothetical protein